MKCTIMSPWLGRHHVHIRRPYQSKPEDWFLLDEVLSEQQEYAIPFQEEKWNIVVVKVSWPHEVFPWAWW